jgi:hypothetical protein
MRKFLWVTQAFHLSPNLQSRKNGTLYNVTFSPHRPCDDLRRSAPKVFRGRRKNPLLSLCFSRHQRREMGAKGWFWGAFEAQMWGGMLRKCGQSVGLGALERIRDELLIGVDRNQLGRRNLTDEQRAVVIGRLYKTIKQNPVLNLKQFQTDNSDRDFKLKSRSGSDATAKAIAKQAGVGATTVWRAEKFANAVEALQEISPQAAERVLRGEVRDAITELPKVPKEALSFVAEKIEEGKRVIKEILREWRYQQLEAPPLPKEKFDVIYIVFQSRNQWFDCYLLCRKFCL